jgi:hypothetical protein
MKLYKLYENSLNEVKIEACLKGFGLELFGDELGGSEKNTNTENRYVEYIQDFTDNKYGEETEPEFIKAISILKKCINSYPEILVPEKTIVYRGLTLPLNYFIDNKKEIPINGEFNYMYKASSPIQSWTKNFDIAATFGNNDIVNEVANKVNFRNINIKDETHLNDFLNDMLKENIRLPFILVHQSSPSEFIFKSKYFKELSMATHEDELIRFTNKPIGLKAKFNNHEDVFLSMGGLMLIKLINRAINVI